MRVAWKGGGAEHVFRVDLVLPAIHVLRRDCWPDAHSQGSAEMMRQCAFRGAGRIHTGVAGARQGPMKIVLVSHASRLADSRSEPKGIYADGGWGNPKAIDREGKGCGAFATQKRNTRRNYLTKKDAQSPLDHSQPPENVYLPYNFIVNCAQKRTQPTHCNKSKTGGTANPRQKYSNK